MSTTRKEPAESSPQYLNLSPQDLDPTKRHVVGVAIIVTQPDQPNLGRYGLLILKRANEEQDFPNAWELPGGHIEKHDQTVFHAVVRETQEETGQEIDAVLGQLDDMLWESSSGASNVQLNYVVSVKAGKPVVLNPEEHSEWVWADESAIDGRFMTPEMRAVIANAFQFAKSHNL